MVDLNQMEYGDVFSELSYYVLTAQNPIRESYSFTNLQSGESVQLGGTYVRKYLISSSQYLETVKVGLNDKLWTKNQIDKAEASGEIEKNSVRVGDVRVPGILTIWSNIGNKCFKAIFKKKDKDKTKKALKEEKENRVRQFLFAIEEAEVLGNSISAVVERYTTELIENPILPFIEGEDREFHGYKLEHVSKDGKYRCVDLKLDPEDDHSKGIRQITVSNIKELVVDNVRYIRE